MSGIFICYRRNDANTAVVVALHNRLERRFGDDDVFFDTEDMKPGDNFPKRIRAALEEADVVLAVIGPKWVDTIDEDKEIDWVRDELVMALEHDIPIVPVLVEDAKPLEPAELPDNLRKLAHHHAQSIGKELNRDIDDLIEHLEFMVGQHNRSRPQGTSTGEEAEAAITFLFTDIEDSSVKWEQHMQAMRQALAKHDDIIHRAADAHGGKVFGELGDGMSIAFDSPIAAVLAAYEAQHTLQDQVWEAVGGLKVRMAIITGTPQHRDGNYFGPTLNRAARLLELANGTQILLANATQ